MQHDPVFIGVDVGTGSARAGIFRANGEMLASARHDIRLWRDTGKHAEQSSDDIWLAVCHAVRSAVFEARIVPERIAGVGFDAACSLVLLSPAGRPVSVSDSGDPARNVIVWMDHRAEPEASIINQTGHRILRHVGNNMSPEMQLPKLLWLKKNRPESYAATGHFFDLADYLTWRATGSLIRSTCTLTCKWAYDGANASWPSDFLTLIDLEDHVADRFARIGQDIALPGTALPGGLCRAASEDLGLRAGTPVGSGIIDAHAGGIGTLGGKGTDPAGQIAYVFGTSACLMATTREPVFTPGIWGPYYDAMIPGQWLNEGGQSLAGDAIRHCVETHPAFPDAKAKASIDGVAPLKWIERAILNHQDGSEAVMNSAFELHLVPEFLGNRSPHADPAARALIAGLDMETGISGLLRVYAAAVRSVAYGARQTIGALRSRGLPIESVVISGGAAASPLLRQWVADAVNLPVNVPECTEPVLLGAAMLGASACNHYASLLDAADAMVRTKSILYPDPRFQDMHRRGFAAFEDLQATGKRLRAIMEPNSKHSNVDEFSHLIS
jgi:D-ribulokinase